MPARRPQRKADCQSGALDARGTCPSRKPDSRGITPSYRGASLAVRCAGIELNNQPRWLDSKGALHCDHRGAHTHLTNPRVPPMPHPPAYPHDPIEEIATRPLHGPRQRSNERAHAHHSEHGHHPAPGRAQPGEPDPSRRGGRATTPRPGRQSNGSSGSAPCTAWTTPTTSSASAPSSGPRAKSETYPEPKIAQKLAADRPLPFPDAELFAFEGAKQPESALLIRRDPGILLTCDAIQHYGDYRHNTLLARLVMPFIGFPKTTVVGPIWLKMMTPRAAR